MNSWYDKCMPKIKDIKPTLSVFLEDFKKTAGVKSVYIWGSYARNLNRPEFRVRDIDVLAKTTFHSGDLLAIDNNIIKGICSDSYLENMGYDPAAIKFSKRFTNLAKDVDCWSISSDRKLLHWGPVFVNPSESEEMNKKAQRYAEKVTGKERHAINKSSEKIRKNWYENYSNYFKKQFERMPTGWYKTENIKIREITSQAIKI